MFFFIDLFSIQETLEKVKKLNSKLYDVYKANYKPQIKIAVCYYTYFSLKIGKDQEYMALATVPFIDTIYIRKNAWTVDIGRNSSVVGALTSNAWVQGSFQFSVQPKNFLPISVT